MLLSLIGLAILSNEEKVLVMLEYYREYRTLRHIGLGYDGK